MPMFVIPAKAGIQLDDAAEKLDSRLCGNDEKRSLVVIQ